MEFNKNEEKIKETYNKVKIHDMINFDKNEDNISVSIIIPVYNVSQYLEECLDSALNQTLDNIEIICVNDGSTDDSMEILEVYAEMDSRIKVINKDNAGYGHVMNLGMDMAKGEYIGIIESDDYVLPNMFKTLYEVAKENDLDFVKSDFYRFYGEGDNLIKNYNKIAKINENYNILINPKENHECFRFIMNTWSGIYKTKFLRNNSIRHNETPGASFQDNGFWFKANIFAERTMYIQEAYYMNRRDNPNSSVYDPGKVYCMNNEYKSIYDFLEKNDLKKDYLDVYNLKRYHNYMFTLSRISPKNVKEYINSISEEFKESDEKGELYSRYFSPLNLNEIKWMMRNPEEYYYEFFNKKVKVSVILPVYNVEKYLSKCLESLLNQTLTNIEIICINDGSEDNSAKILNEYQNKDQRIKIINQENHGAGYARNRGIEIARGEYLSFLDADDFFDENMLKLAYNEAIQHNADICIYNSYLYDNLSKTTEINNFSIKKRFLPEKKVFNRSDINSNIFKNIMGWAWDKLYKKSFILNNQLEFQDLRTTNDMYFVYSSLLKAGRITILNKPLYYQRRNVTTSLSNSRELSWDCFYYALKKLKNELISMGIYEEYEQDFVNYALHSCLWNYNSLREPFAKELFEILRKEWFDELGISNHDEDYFENKIEYDQYIEMINIPHDDNEYYNYQINYYKKECSAKKVMGDVPIKINNNETLTIDQLIEKLLWNRKELSKYKSKYKSSLDQEVTDCNARLLSDYTFNYFEDLDNFENTIGSISIKISNNEIITLNELINKLLWNRNELKKYKKKVFETKTRKSHTD